MDQLRREISAISQELDKYSDRKKQHMQELQQIDEGTVKLNL